MCCLCVRLAISRRPETLGLGSVRGAWGRGRPNRNGPPPPPWGLGPSAEGPGEEKVGGINLGWGHIKVLDKAPTVAYKTNPKRYILIKSSNIFKNASTKKVLSIRDSPSVLNKESPSVFSL